MHDLLLDLAEQYGWKLEAWAVFSNHYHFIAQSPNNPQNLRKLITHLHAASAKKLNEKHKTPGRIVWYQYWDSRVTFQNSYMARLKYVMHNPVRHKIVDDANDYPWCSASWFGFSATKAFQKSVDSFSSDKVAIIDDF